MKAFVWVCVICYSLATWTIVEEIRTGRQKPLSPGEQLFAFFFGLSLSIWGWVLIWTDAHE